jgi:UDP-N-acetylglucosamine 4,6-dehydratase/5-epimerase
MNVFKDKKILITGGTGTIGNFIIDKLLRYRPRVIRVYSRDENKQLVLKERLGDRKNIRYLIGDIRDKNRLNMATKDIDIIFHTAALKHVLSCEYNPFEAVKTNIIGTQNLIEVAMENMVETVVLTSSDKAVNPGNTMGVSKLMAEKLFIAANSYKGSEKTKFFVVRFGNILGSRGSVVPLFKEQILKGGPLTITDPEMTRFIMSINEAVELLIKTVLMSRGSEIFVLKMPVIKIGILASAMLEYYASVSGLKASSKIIGSRPGEKLYEELLTIQELDRVIEMDDMYVIIPSLDLYRLSFYNFHCNRNSISKTYKSSDIEPLSKKQTIELLLKEDLL